MYKRHKLASAKSTRIEKLLEREFRKVGIYKFNQVFARDNNVTDFWTSFGDQLSPASKIMGIYVNTGNIPEEFLPRRKSEIDSREGHV